MPTPLPFLPVSTLAFVLFGALLVLVGSSQDELRSALDLDLARTGLLASSVMVGIGIGVLVGGPLVDRLPRRPLFSLAAGITGLSLYFVGPNATFEQVAILLLLAGLGAGLYETVLNAAAIERYADNSVRRLALMHSGATLGAMLTPLGVSWVLARTDWTLAFRGVGVAHLALAAIVVAVPLGAPSSLPERSARERRRVISAPLVFLLIAAFAYIGVESSVTAFAVPYADALGLGADRGRGAISVFWLGLLLGRLAFAMRAGVVDDAGPAAVAGAVAGIAIATSVLLGWTQIEALFGVVGFAMGGVFPLLVALGGRLTPQATGTGVAVVAGLGSAGGFVTPWATGLIGDAAGIGMAVGSLAAWCGLVVLSALLSGRNRESRPE